jgi:hypothetical protein
LPSGGGHLDPERLKSGRIATHTDNTGTGMRADDGPKGMDEQRLGDGFELASHSFGVGFRAGVPDDDADALPVIDGLAQLDNPVERPLKGSHAL